MKKILSFKEFEHNKAKKDKSRTESFTPPEHVIEPAKDDKGFKIVKDAFDKMETILEPSIKSVK